MADNAEDDTGDYNAPLLTRRVLYHLLDPITRAEIRNETTTTDSSALSNDILKSLKGL